MSERVKLTEDETDYFATENKNYKFVKTGCGLLDYILGGGWVIGRFANIVGDSSCGKTLLAIEACANFVKQFPKGKIFYRETELAFDVDYASSLGMPIERVDFVDNSSFVTIEDYYNDLSLCVEEIKERGVEGLYIVDSLDGLSDEAEMKREFSEGSFGTERAKKMHKLFRMVNAKVSEAGMCHLVISQEKDKVGGLPFAKKSTRSGGRALDFFASQIIWLTYLGKHTIPRQGIKRTVGINVKAKCEKNKVSMPYKECEFMIRFGSGIDSFSASIDFLQENKMFDRVTNVGVTKYRNTVEAMSDEDFWKESERVDSIAIQCAREIDNIFLEGIRKKYR